MDSQLPISRTNGVLGVYFSDREVHTIGGFVTAWLWRTPKVGDSIEQAGFRTSLEEATQREAVVCLKVEP